MALKLIQELDSLCGLTKEGSRLSAGPPRKEVVSKEMQNDPRHAVSKEENETAGSSREEG
jgi:hypothetical protein